MRVCFFIVTAALYVVSACAAAADSLLEVDGHHLKWNASTAADPTVITYAVLTGPYSLPADKRILSPSNCSSMLPFSSIVSKSPGIPGTEVRQELRSAFAAWQTAAGISFLEVSDPLQANIVVGAQEFAEGRAFTNLSYRVGHTILPVAKALGKPGSSPSVRPSVQQEGGPAKEIEQSYICLNPQVRWKIGFDGDLEVYDLRYTFTHEIGHAIGLDHPGSTGSVMSFRYDERVRELQPSDVAAVRSLYGPPKLGR